MKKRAGLKCFKRDKYKPYFFSVKDILGLKEAAKVVVEGRRGKDVAKTNILQEPQLSHQVKPDQNCQNSWYKIFL